jgi:flagellar motor switch protein FliG
MTEFSLENVSGRTKAAALLISLGPDASATVVKLLRQEQIDQVTGEIIRLRKVPTDMRNAIFLDAFEETMSRHYIAQGGMEFAREVLSRVLGPQKALEILEQITSDNRNAPFDFVQHTDPAQLVAWLEAEHPQTVALVLSHLPSEFSGRLLSGLDYEMQADVASRIALMGQTGPDVTRQVEAILKQKLAAFATEGYRTAGGVDYIVRVLNTVDSRTERGILESIEHNDPDLASEIRRRMFVFDDLVNLDDKSMQRLLREVDDKDLGLALRGAGDPLKEKIFKNKSSRAAQMLKEDMEVMGPVRLRVVEEAQQTILGIVRRLQESEEITLSRGKEDVFI